MDLVFGYLAGALTLLNPCVLPVLPVILIAALNQHRLGPLVLCAGLSITFVSLGVFLAAIGPAIGVDDQIVSQVAASLMILFGATLVVPVFAQRFAILAGGATATLSNRTAGYQGNGLSGQFLTGVLLGAVWSPCIGPTLGGAIALAAEGNNIPWATAIMTAFALGISTVILLLATLSREALIKRRETLQTLSVYARPIMGWLLIALGVFILFGLHKVIEAWAIDVLPFWFQDLSILI
ncbi:MAG: cytochrome c biogenesis CcdA family protein [Pseudomonadota bacterium]